MDGKGEVDYSENVVRLPRDWVGPLEELVPIGPRARARARESQAQPERGDDSGSSPERGEGIHEASDFWGEGSADLHHAIQGPPLDPAELAIGAPLAAHSNATSRRRGTARHRRPLIRGTSLAAACALLVAITIGVVTVLRPGVTSRHAATGATASGSLVDFGTVRSALDSGISGVGVQITRLSQRARARTAHHRDSVVYRRVQRDVELDASEVRRAAVRAQAQAASSARASTAREENDAPSTAATISTEAASTGAEDTGSGVSTGSAGSPSGGGSTATAAGSSSGGGSAAASAGPTGVGEATGGCTPKCHQH
jgi:hypothetical protein